MSTTNTRVHTSIIFALAFVLRFGLLQFTNVPDALVHRVELSTPITSFKRALEGVFLYTNNQDPYDGGVFHQAPLVLFVFKALGQPLVWINALYASVDVLSGMCLLTIHNTQKLQLEDLKMGPIAVISIFLFNPYTLATSLARSTIVFTNLAIFFALASAQSNRHKASMVALALAVYLSLYPILLFPPVMMLCQAHGTSRFSSLLVYFFGALGLFLYGSYVFMQSPKYLASTYGVILLVPDLTPNVGLWWYFFIEMFDPFRNFFLSVFQLNLLIYVAPLCIKLPKHPLFIITTLLGLTCIFKSYPSVGDLALYVSLLPLQMHYTPRKNVLSWTNAVLRYSFIAIAVTLYCSVLGPTFYHLWIYAGSGNANFFYAITLVYNLGLTLFVTDWLFAVLRRDWEVTRPDMKGREVVQM